jgi:hypothetical protein
MAELTAGVLPTGKCLLASLQTKMSSKRISHSLFDRAANLFAPVFLTRLQSPALLLAFVVF